MAGPFAFHPQLISGAAVEGDEAGGAGQAEGLVVHEADHEDAMRGRVLYDRGDQAVEFAVIETHFCDRSPDRAIKKPAGTAAGILSFDLQNRIKPRPARYRSPDGGDGGAGRRGSLT